MTSLKRYAIASALILCCGVFAGAQSQTKAPKKGSVAGKVAIKGKAAVGIVVGLRTSDSGSPYEPSFRATTDPEGKYRLNDIPSGSYQVAPIAPAFVISNPNMSRGETVVLIEGENVEGIDFTLVRGGVITGKVTDADSRPVVEQRVNLFPADPPPNQRGPTFPISSSQTDDRGIYRMFGLAAGRYKVAVGESTDNFFMTVVSGRPSYKQTFHPDVTDSAKATIVEVTEGDEKPNIDIALGRATQTFAVSGRVTDGENDQPVPNVRFGLQLIMADQRRAFISTPATSNNQGEFKIENLGPGKYAVFALPQQDSDIRADVISFDIVDQDVTGLVIRTSKGMSLAGTIVLENTDDKTVFAKLVRLSVQGFVQSEGPSGNIVHSATINPDGSFLIRGLETGMAYISLSANQGPNLLKGFTVARLERDGIIQPRGIDIKSGDQITGVRLVVSYGSAIIHGVVKVENGALPDGARLFVRVTKAGEATSNLRSPQVDARGHFIMEGVSAGTYNFDASIFNPAAPNTVLPRAKQQVNVSDGVVTEVTITIDLTQKSSVPSP